ISGRVDVAQVGLLGHSRGGEAVLQVPDDLAKGGADFTGVTVRSILSLAPTDTGTITTTLPAVPFMTLLPAGGGDLVEKDGARIYDRIAPAPFKSQLYVHRTNHNRFNREWVNDDFDAV